MPVYAATDYRIEIASQNMSSFLTSATLEFEAEELETTAYASGGWRTRIPGLRSGSVTLAFNQDFASSTVDDRLWGWFTSGQAQTIRIRPTSAAVTATNPEYQGSVIVVSYTPVAGAVGELGAFDVTWPTTGAFVRATS